MLFLYLRWKNLHATLVMKGALTDEEALDFADEQFAETVTKLVVPDAPGAASRFNDSLGGTLSHFSSSLRSALLTDPTCSCVVMCRVALLFVQTCRDVVLASFEEDRRSGEL